MALRSIVHVITGLHVGGAERMLLQLMQHRAEDRFDHRVVSLTSGGVLADQIRRAGVEVTELGLNRHPFSPARTIELVRILIRCKPDLVQTWLYHADLVGTLAARLARVPRIAWNLRCEAIHYPRSAWRNRLVQRALVRLSPSVAAVLFNSHSGRKTHEEIGYRNSTWIFAPNGVDTERFRPDPAARPRLRQALGLLPEMPLLGFVGRFDPLKGHTTLLDALCRLPQAVHAVLIGRGNELANEALAGLIANRQLRTRVHLLGERTDVHELLPGVDAFVLASTTEGCPNALLEAMACGVPCVTTDVGDAARIVGPTGVVVRPDDAAALAQGIGAALAAGGEVGRACREAAVLGLDIRVARRRYGEVWETIVDRPRARSPD